MKKNKNRIRSNEIKCLNLIKSSFFGQRLLTKDFDNSNPEITKCILETASHNSNPNSFPDFFFNKGIIEHFEISSSEETNKGAKYKIDYAKEERKNQFVIDEQLKEHSDKDYLANSVKIKTIENTHKCFSYEAFLNSFIRNTNKHLISLKKNSFSDQIIVFLIELQDGKLCIYDHDKFSKFYKISDDRKLLKYIKDNLLNVDFLIFLNVDSYEIIDIAKIDDLLVGAKHSLDVRGGVQRNIVSALFIDL